MYQIDKTSNNLIKLEERLFGELGIRERDHLQEWIAKNPEVLGEELLIIQKEFSGFNDTNERFDLLALDKDGNLVIIENKLDDTGRDVTWQALKYTSYCSTLTTSEIVELFQKYLNQYGNQENASELLLEYFDLDNEDDLLLNEKDQRIILVANHYRKEVTSTVLWLRNRDIDIRCIRATPYSKEKSIFLQMEQIIPVPETEEFMVNLKQKEQEEKEKSKKVSQSEELLVEFWSALKNDLNKNGIQFLDRVKANPYYDIGFWQGKGRFAFCIGRGHIRVELYLSDDRDKLLFNSLYAHKAEIEANFPGELIWQKLEGKAASRLKHQLTSDNLGSGWFRDNPDESWIEAIKWFRENMVQFYNAVSPVWEKVQKDLV